MSSCNRQIKKCYNQFEQFKYIKIKIIFHFLPNLTGFKVFALPTREDKSTVPETQRKCHELSVFCTLCPLSPPNAMLGEGRGWGKCSCIYTWLFIWREWKSATWANLSEDLCSWLWVQDLTKPCNNCRGITLFCEHGSLGWGGGKGTKPQKSPIPPLIS